MSNRATTLFITATLALAGWQQAAAQTADGKYYLFAAIGSADTSFRPSPVDVIDDDDNAFDVGAGIRLGDYLALQLAYHDFGEPIGFAGCPPGVFCIQAFSPEPVAVDGWSASVVGNWPLGERVSLYGKLGVLAWDAAARSPSLDDSGEDLLLGAGVSVRLSQQWSLQLGYERVELDISATRLGAAFSF